jgi:hypothetical protein
VYNNILAYLHPTLNSPTTGRNALRCHNANGTQYFADSTEAASGVPYCFRVAWVSCPLGSTSANLPKLGSPHKLMHVPRGCLVLLATSRALPLHFAILYSLMNLHLVLQMVPETIYIFPGALFRPSSLVALCSGTTTPRL